MQQVYITLNNDNIKEEKHICITNVVNCQTIFKFNFRLAKILTCLLLLPHPCDLKQTQGGAVLQSVDLYTPS